MSGHAAAGPIGATHRSLAGRLIAPFRGVRFPVALSLILIAGSFAAAATIQMRRDRESALEQAGFFEARRAAQIASDMGGVFDRYARLGRAFANAASAEATGALADAGGPALKNIAILDLDGALVSQMKGTPRGLLPLQPNALKVALAGRAAVPIAHGKTLAVLFRDGPRLVAVLLDAGQLLPPAGMQGAAVSEPDGQPLLTGPAWDAPLPYGAMALAGRQSAVRTLKLAGGRRLLALSSVPGWPAVAGASIAVNDALGAWYGSLPLYLFAILGPALAGAGLAVVFVREFERRARAAEAVKALRSTKPEEARLLIRLADAERRAIEAQRSKAEFIAHMSHELRTPLNAVIGFSEVIEHGIFGAPGHPKYVEYAHDIAAAGRGLHKKIGDILDYADIEAGKHPIAQQTVDMAQAMRGVLDELAGRAFSRRIRLVVSLPDSAPARADAHAVKRILTNLIANALEFTPNGGQVRVQVRGDDGAIAASVRDTGYGFAANEREKAGQPFVRFDRPNGQTGAGLGLAIAMMLARRMGGALRITGAEGEGASVELRLPAAR